MGKKKHDVKVGDVFYMKISGEDKYSYGQVISLGETSECIIIFDITSNSHPEINDIVQNPILFVAQTVTVKIEDNEWGYIGNIDTPENITLPEYICDTLDGKVILNYKGEILRKATNDEIETFITLKSCSPAIVEDAVNSKYGKEEWYPYLDNLLYKK